MFSWFYDGYIRVMSFLGGYRPEVLVAKNDKRPTLPMDLPATNYGSRYRGAGVFTGLLGIAIVFTAIAPSAFALTTDWALQVFGVVKVLMMLIMLIIVRRIGGANGLKQDWINSRLASERKRYSDLEKAILELRGGLNTACTEKVKVKLRSVLNGAESQIHYNSNRANQYEAIEKTTAVLGIIIFYVALFAACGLLVSEFHIIPHQTWLILFTAFFPAALGGLHGINGFLTIGSLAMDHRKMQKFLIDALKNLESSNASEPDTVLKIADEVVAGLNSRDHEWKEKTNEGINLSLA